MDGKNEGGFPDGRSGDRQWMSPKDFYLTKSQVTRRFRGNKLRADHDENLLKGLQYEMNEIRKFLDCLRLPWMKLADAFFQGYVNVPLYNKEKRLLASQLIELMVKLSGRTSFVDEWLKYNSLQVKEIKELLTAYKIKRLYSITIGDELLYDLSLKQLVEIHDTIEMFLGNSSFQEFEDDDLYAVDVSVSVSRFADQDFYSVSYDVDTNEGEMRFTSSGQMRYVIEQMQQFLDRMENKEFVDIEDSTEKEKVVIREDYTPRERVLNETPVVDRCIRQCDGDALTENYTISANALYLNDLSPRVLRNISARLEEFLESTDKHWEELRTPLKCLNEGFES